MRSRGWGGWGRGLSEGVGVRGARARVRWEGRVVEAVSLAAVSPTGTAAPTFRLQSSGPDWTDRNCPVAPNRSRLTPGAASPYLLPLVTPDLLAIFLASRRASTADAKGPPAC